VGKAQPGHQGAPRLGMADQSAEGCLQPRLQQGHFRPSWVWVAIHRPDRGRGVVALLTA
jgi:hypothetical protein